MKTHLLSAGEFALCGQTRMQGPFFSVDLTEDESKVTCLRCRTIMNGREFTPTDALLRIANARWSLTTLDDTRAMAPVLIMNTKQVQGYLEMMAVSGWKPGQKGVTLRLLAEDPT